VLHVTGAAYTLGDLGPGASGVATVSVSGESSLLIIFTKRDGTRARLDAGGYLEPGYRGRIDVTVNNEEIEHVDDRTNIF
jgi:hypothetical protein